VELIVGALEKLESATTNDIISWIRNQGCEPPPPRVVSQICSCLAPIEKNGMRGAYVVWKLKKKV
jgi:hypothetical protein